MTDNKETKDWSKLAGKEAIEKTINFLKANGINAVLAKNAEDAKNKALSLIPKGAEIMTITSVTLDSLGISKEINESGNYNPVRDKLYSMNRETQKKEMKSLGSSPEYVIGSVHAVAQDGKIIVASNTGSQLPAYAYGSLNVIFVVGTQKIVENLDEGMKRIYEHSLVLESERAKKAYGVPGSFVSKILIINKEIDPNRVNLIFVPEVVGF